MNSTRLPFTTDFDHLSELKNLLLSAKVNISFAETNWFACGCSTHVNVNPCYTPSICCWRCLSHISTPLQYVSYIVIISFLSSNFNSQLQRNLNQRPLCFYPFKGHPLVLKLGLWWHYKTFSNFRCLQLYCPPPTSWRASKTSWSEQWHLNTRCFTPLRCLTAMLLRGQALLVKRRPGWQGSGVLSLDLTISSKYRVTMFFHFRDTKWYKYQATPSQTAKRTHKKTSIFPWCSSILLRTHLLPLYFLELSLAPPQDCMSFVALNIVSDPLFLPFKHS